MSGDAQGAQSRHKGQQRGVLEVARVVQHEHVAAQHPHGAALDDAQLREIHDAVRGDCLGGMRARAYECVCAWRSGAERHGGFFFFVVVIRGVL